MDKVCRRRTKLKNWLKCAGQRNSSFWNIAITQIQSIACAFENGGILMLIQTTWLASVISFRMFRGSFEKLTSFRFCVGFARIHPFRPVLSSAATPGLFGCRTWFLLPFVSSLYLCPIDWKLKVSNFGFSFCFSGKKLCSSGWSNELSCWIFFGNVFPIRNKVSVLAWQVEQLFEGLCTF